jgi:hypothetical protein
MRLCLLYKLAMVRKITAYLGVVVLMIACGTVKGNVQQVPVTGVVTDCELKAPVRYATVELKGKPDIAANTDTAGRFTLWHAIGAGDSLTVRCPGYVPITLAAKSNLQACLSVREHNLPALTIKPDAQEKVVGEARRLSAPAAGYAWKVGHMRALFVPPGDVPPHAVIKRVGAFVTGQGKPQAPFRFRLLGVDATTGAPGTDIVLMQSFSAAKKGREWVFAEVPGGGVPAPVQGFFIVVENVFTDSSYYYREPLPKKFRSPKPMYGNCIASGAFRLKGNEWNYLPGIGWRQTEWYGNDSGTPTPGTHQINLQAIVVY